MREKLTALILKKFVLLVLILSLCMLMGCQGNEKGKVSVTGGVVKKEDNKTAPPNGSDKKDSPNGSDKKDSPNGSDKKDVDKNSNLVFDPVKVNPIAKSNIKSTGDAIEWNSFDGTRMSFKVISADFSKTFQGKSFGDYEKEKMKSAGIKTDDKGNITDAHTYIWIKLEAENKAGKCRWTPEQFPILGIKEDLTLEEDEIFICYVNGMQVESGRKDEFYVTFESGEKKEFLLGFRMSDSLLDEKVGYYISEFSNPNTPDKNSFIVQLN